VKNQLLRISFTNYQYYYACL